jgi:UDP-glucuronate 4-epimerase
LNPSVPWSEDDHQLKPISPYAVTKLAGEFMGHVHSCLGDFRFMALRFFTVYGPRQRPDLAIAKITRLMKQGLPVPMYGDGSTERDYTYIDDIVEGIILSLGYNRTPFEVINIGNNQTISLNDMVSGIESALGVVAHRRYGAMQPGDVPKTYACIKKAQELLGYSPKTKFADGLRSYVKWVSDNEDILRDS